MLPMTTTLKNGIPSDSSLSIPQELLDYILDFLYDDSPTLANLRYHIYSNVFIVHITELDRFRDQFAGQLYQCQNLAALLEHSPHVAPLVTRFGIHGNTEFITDIFEDTFLSPIIQALRNLSHIEFICRRYEGLWDIWDDFPVATPRIFVAALRSVPLKTFICDGIGLDLSQHKTLSSFFMILASRLDSRLLGVRLSPALRTFTVEQVYCDREYSSRKTVDAWAEFDAHVDGLWQPALRRVHVRLHDNTHGICENYECHGRDDGMCDCYACECELRDRHGYNVPVDHDKWKYQVEESMPSLRGRGILEVEVVKRRLTF
ncbi:hypothetical protein F5146DRAFT_1028758 [Armillaria mellea]|nr:hypothetical protein F5146DRAFT_1028758 [Armillaria mellea]